LATEVKRLSIKEKTRDVDTGYFLLTICIINTTDSVAGVEQKKPPSW
jgi:hypothetical protein